MKQAEGVPIVAPTLLLPEAASAIRRSQDDPDLACRFAEALGLLPHLTLIPLDQLLALQALDAAVFWLRGGDSEYVAVAQRYACLLVTLDVEQHERAAAALKIFYPAELRGDL